MSAILNTYNRKKISFKKGKGSFLYATNGKKYLDFVQGIAVNCLGHSNNYLIKSIYKQSKKLWHVSNAFQIPEQEKLAKRLKQKTFADYVSFQNSGAEATEAAIRVSDRRWNLRLRTGIDGRLPEKDISVALDRLEEFQREHALFDRDVVAVDLRVPDRLIVRVNPNAPKAKVRKTGGKDT